MLLTGTGASGGLAMAPVCWYRHAPLWTENAPVDDAQAELLRFEAARAAADGQLEALASRAKQTLGEENAQVFELHRMMLDDADYLDDVARAITGKQLCAEYAVSETARRFAASFANMKNEYMRARAADVLDISRRVLQNLSGAPDTELPAEGPVILASEDFSPSDTARFALGVVAGLAASGGTTHSHAAIFARAMGIPAVVGVEGLAALSGGELVILDGDNGILHSSPTDEQIALCLSRQKLTAEEADARAAWRGRPTVTAGGKAVKLFANIGSVNGADDALQNDAEGVGLFRSEFLFLARTDAPGEEEQYAAYSAVLRKMGGRRVVIRTLDAGADKQAPCLGQSPEPNPALGLRGIRLCLRRPELFKTQLRAICRASAHGDAAILLPMVTSADEVRQTRALLEEVQRGLAESGHAFSQNILLGVMIETPAAAILSDQLANEADFFSIGTNDLTQYTLASDRVNEAVRDWYDERSEAVLRLVAQTVENAHSHGIPAAVCGELAADEAMAPYFLGLGVDELSVAPGKILPLRKYICEEL